MYSHDLRYVLCLFLQNNASLPRVRFISFTVRPGSVPGTTHASGNVIIILTVMSCVIRDMYMYVCVYLRDKIKRKRGGCIFYVKDHSHTHVHTHTHTQIYTQSYCIVKSCTLLYDHTHTHCALSHYLSV